MAREIQRHGVIYVGVLLTVLLAGCFQLQKEGLEKRQFILDVTRPGGEETSASDAVLLVNPFQITTRYEGKGLKYRKKDLSFESDFYNEFYTRPGAMISEEVVDWLSRSGLFARVMSDTGQRLPTHVLEGTVQVLHGDYRPDIPQAVMEIEFVLMEGAGSGSEILLRKTYRKEIPARGGTPEDLVLAWNQGLSEILTSLERDLSELSI